MAATSPDSSPRPAAPIGPFLVAAAVVICITALVCVLARRKTDGQWVYALDDAYIHLSMARNLIHHGTWGINPGEFAGASSSPLWTLLISASFKLLGAKAILPLALNFVAELLALVAIWRFLTRYIRGGWVAAIACVLLALAAPLPMLVISGMEHSLQVALVFALMSVVARSIGASTAARAFADSSRDISRDAMTHSRGDGAGFLLRGVLLCILLVATRFEGLFLIGALCAMLAWRGRWGTAFVFGLAAFAPVGVYAWYSMTHGGSWLPNSVLLKGETPPHSPAALVHFVLAGFWRTARKAIVSVPMALAVILGMLLRGREDRPASEARFLLGWFFLAALLHGQFAAIGWYSRYEAYLVGMGGAIIFAALAVYLVPADGNVARSPRRRLGPVCCVILCVTIALLTVRASVSLRRDVNAPNGIYRQQVQMGRFAHESLGGRAVAVNDIGAVAWYGDAYVVDVYGLANREIFLARRSGTFGPATMEAVCRKHDAALAMIYPEWFDWSGGLPTSWQEIGEWTTPNNVAAAGNVVHFYAIDPTSRRRLQRDFNDFTPQLPWGVASEAKELAARTK